MGLIHALESKETKILPRNLSFRLNLGKRKENLYIVDVNEELSDI